MVSVPTDKGEIDLPESLIAAIQRQATENAIAAAAIIRGWGTRPVQKVVLPKAFLLEIGSLSLLMEWDSLGHLDVLGENMPELRQVKEEFLNRCGGGLVAFGDASETPITSLMLKTLTEKFSWDGPELMNASFVLDEVDEDELVDALATFLWNNRATIEQIIIEERASEET